MACRKSPRADSAFGAGATHRSRGAAVDGDESLEGTASPARPCRRSKQQDVLLWLDPIKRGLDKCQTLQKGMYWSTKR